jgi:YVTN family beta-propeller protein
MSSLRLLVALLVAALVPAATALAAPPFLAFESGPVRPLALSPDGTRLFAANVPDGRLEIFDVIPSGLGLRHRASVPVGLEPVAVAARSNAEVWVVNHLSDSVSVVDVASSPPRVVRTLLVGDEPRDIVFAGPGGARAFITTAHRGQQRSDASLAGVPGAGDPQLTTPGIGRADVWVFDATSLGSAFGGTPLRIVTLFGDTPRALAVSPDGSTVYAAVFYSGNRTTAISEGVVCNGFDPFTACTIKSTPYPGGLPGPSGNYAGAPAPEVGLIVRQDPVDGHWKDELGRIWDAAVRFDLPDLDVFSIDATTLAQTGSWAHVGTTLFNMAVNPVSGKLYVSNTEARNEVRFEGPGVFASSTVQGHLAEARITVISGGTVTPRHLNSHIDYEVRPAPPGTADHSLATPLEMVLDSTGSTLYVAAYGSSRIGVLDVAALETGSFDPEVASADYIEVTGGGPSGLVLDEARGRLYAMTRFDDSVVVLDLASGTQTGRLPLHNPEPASLVAGRPFLHDARISSSNGEASCASCHVFGDLDHLAWDLGDPDGDVTSNPIPVNLGSVAVSQAPSPLNGVGQVDVFHPMKGPMTTQTLRGMVNSGAMHWRGDRANGLFGVSATDADLSFRNFIVAFPGLLGRDSLLPAADMQKFSDFALQLVLPPNPVTPLNNTLVANSPAERGRAFFFGQVGPDSGGGHRSDGVPFLDGLGFTCNGCHTLDPTNGFFGTGRRASFENEPQIVKISHLRNAYQKIGMFGMPAVNFFLDGDNGHEGPQVRGYGFLHDGSVDTLFRFFRATVFRLQNFSFTTVGFENDQQRRNVEQFMLQFPSDLAPIVGQQITLDDTNAAAVNPRVDLLLQRAAAAFTSQILGPGVTECDLVVKGSVAGQERGFVHVGGVFQSDRAAEAALSAPALRALATVPGQALTFTCVPPGSGMRMGVDRDLDGTRDRDELDAATNPANPGSLPGACSDAIDNDGDGLVDLADGGCLNAFWNIENPACDDGIDNDGDGFADHDGAGLGAPDPQCVGRPFGRNEKPSGCGLGAELALAVPLLAALRRRRR